MFQRRLEFEVATQINDLVGNGKYEELDITVRCSWATPTRTFIFLINLWVMRMMELVLLIMMHLMTLLWGGSLVLD